jgi:hypothetical protein
VVAGSKMLVVSLMKPVMLAASRRRMPQTATHLGGLSCMMLQNRATCLLMRKQIQVGH